MSYIDAHEIDEDVLYAAFENEIADAVARVDEMQGKRRRSDLFFRTQVLRALIIASEPGRPRVWS